MTAVIVFLCMGTVAGLNHMAIMEPLIFRAALFRGKLGGLIFDGLALLGVIASLVISVKLFQQTSFGSFIAFFIIFGGIGYGIGGALIKSMLGGILPLVSNVAIILLAIYL